MWIDYTQCEGFCEQKDINLYYSYEMLYYIIFCRVNLCSVCSFITQVMINSGRAKRIIQKTNINNLNAATKLAD